MKPLKNATILLITIIIISSAAAIGYNQNWFQTSNPTLRPTPETDMNFTLEIYGNANMDNKIDQKDIAYIQDIIADIKPTTTFADANRDGSIDQKDIDIINTIINGTFSQMHLLDGNGKNITITHPPNRVIIEYIQNAELARILQIQDKIVGVDFCVDQLKTIYFPENTNNIKTVGNMNTPDYEAILNLNPDILLTFSNATSEKASKLPGVDVIYLGLYYPNVLDPVHSEYIQAILKAGYIFNKVNQATSYTNWLLDLTNAINVKTSTLTATQKQSVFITNYPYTASTTLKAYMTIDTLGQACILAGGNNIASTLPTYLTATSADVDAEWILQQNPSYIFLHTVRYTYAATTNADPAQGIDVNDATSIRNCLEQWRSQEQITNLAAVKNNNVYIISGDFRNNAMGGTLGAVYIAKILYPDLLSDINPQTIHQDYITNYLHLNYNLDKNGVFLYPAITDNGDTLGIPNGAK
ncbi:MAG: ABC transporter substrate-binding protein [Candidatus Bathyarchaeota archaeon]|uniref:ABC transporter substrate-binding protein n=1 Tax=Candidatus Bathycorpusculum sp. TaxID=2994959 RepID=UPI0028277FEA|nr:ABC transporter substrate-binding protein [Candidatus Termiticorpusculum sp.]MCL2293065.1 ABC transporter substrate-binding protein [Candidatus Termiticorpusculum sp.]